MNVTKLLVDDQSTVPVYVQVREQLLAAIGRGELTRGEQLPSVRDVAAALAINPNTVNRAYAELERDGVVETRRGRGTFIRSNRRPNDGRRLVEISDRFVAHARSLGYEGAQIVATVRARVAALGERKRREP
jgi:GntR family transcriptional regulator